MKADVKAQWVAALRSGTYQQGQAQLRRKIADGSYQYCCLGVLCAITPEIEFELDERKDYAGFIGKPESSSLCFMPIGSVEFFSAVTGEAESPVDYTVSVESYIEGLDGRNGERTSLIGLNDNGFTFDQIADVIEYFL